MVERQTSSVGGHTHGGFPEEFAICVVRDAVGGPVEAVFVVAVCWEEWDGCGPEELGSIDIWAGVDDEKEICGFGGWGLIEFGKEFDIDFLGVIKVLQEGVKDSLSVVSRLRLAECKRRRYENRMTYEKESSTRSVQTGILHASPEAPIKHVSSGRRNLRTFDRTPF